LKKVQAIKDRWAARMQVVCKVKYGIGNDPCPTQMVTPNKFCSLFAGIAGTELLTSDAVFEPMRGKQSMMIVSSPSIIFGG
jgi:hypothetical protein